MKKEVKKASKEEKLQSLIDYFIDNDISEFNTEILIHTNIQALGDKSFIDATRNGEWDLAWNVAELYVSGDLW